MTPSSRDDRDFEAPWQVVRPLERFVAERHLGPAVIREPLFDPRWERQILTTLLATEVDDDRVDERVAVEILARGRTPDPVPMLRRRSVGHGVQVLVGLGEGMEPIVGRTSVDVVTFDDSPTRIGPDGRSYRPPGAKCPVLALTDLGVGGSPLRADRVDHREWREVARVLRERGSPLVVLNPYEPSRWPREAYRWAVLIHWDRPTRLTHAFAARRTWNARR